MAALVGRFGVNVRYESQARPVDELPAGGTGLSGRLGLIVVISRFFGQPLPSEAPGCTPSLAVP